MIKKRLIAINLPQFHPIPENDNWWGKGFTEWRNVVNSKPKFNGHYQPQLPTETGYYDLRLHETREMQAQMAKASGIYGFCYYHYWFDGKRLLNEPLDRLLKSKSPDFPFMYCWANENWTRRWDGLDDEVLIKQNYSHDDDLAHIRFLCENIFSDHRYITVDGKPFVCIYRPTLLPNIKATVKTWRSEAKKMGFKNLYIGYFQSHKQDYDPKEIDFDVAVAFPPASIQDTKPALLKGNLRQSLLYNIKLSGLSNDNILKKIFHQIKFFKNPYLLNRIYDYKKLVDLAIKQQKPAYNFFPGITPGWDNSARRKTDALILHNSNPKSYAKWLKHILKTFKPPSQEENFIFINAWNEWAEGNHLEPCQKWGNEYLEATKNAIK